MARDTRVRITKDDHVGLVMESSVPMWERHGWTRADDGSSTETSEPEPAAAEAEPETKASAKKTTTRKAQ